MIFLPLWGSGDFCSLAVINKHSPSLPPPHHPEGGDVESDGVGISQVKPCPVAATPGDRRAGMLFQGTEQAFSSGMGVSLWGSARSTLCPREVRACDGLRSLLHCHFTANAGPEGLRCPLKPRFKAAHVKSHPP